MKFVRITLLVACISAIALVIVVWLISTRRTVSFGDHHLLSFICLRDVPALTVVIDHGVATFNYQGDRCGSYRLAQALVVLPLFALLLSFPKLIWNSANGWCVLGLFIVDHILICGPDPEYSGPNPLATLLLLAWDIMVAGYVVSRKWLLPAKRIDRSRCQVCGYDLRATPERCPECGTMPRYQPLR